MRSYPLMNNHMSQSPVTRNFSGNSRSLRTPKNVLCMHIIIFISFFQITMNSKNLTLFCFFGMRT